MESLFIRTKHYIAFNGVDLHCFNLLKAWDKNNNLGFTFNDAHTLNSTHSSSKTESINNQLRERLRRSKNLLLIVGDETKNRNNNLNFELTYALKNKIPIIAVFKDYKGNARFSEIKKDLLSKLPAVIRNWDKDSKYVVLIPFKESAVTEASKRYSHLKLPPYGYSGFGWLLSLLPLKKSSPDPWRPPFPLKFSKPSPKKPLSLMDILEQKPKKKKEDSIFDSLFGEQNKRKK